MSWISRMGDPCHPIPTKNNTTSSWEHLKDVVGSIAYYDGMSIKLVSKEDFSEAMGTPIGVVVIPQSHMDDGKCRVMSLANMSYKTPETGTLVSTTNPTDVSEAGINLMWGRSSNDIPEMMNYSSVSNIQNSTFTFAYLPSDYWEGKLWLGKVVIGKISGP